jgi:hypothetical protein
MFFQILLTPLLTLHQPQLTPLYFLKCLQPILRLLAIFCSEKKNYLDYLITDDIS